MAIDPNTPVLGGIEGALNTPFRYPTGGLSGVVRQALLSKRTTPFRAELAANQQRTQDAINAVSQAGGSAAFTASISSKIGKRSGGGRRTRKGGSFRIRKQRVKGMGKVKGMRRSRSTRRKR